MEEQIQNCLTSVWEMTTEGEELIVQKLAKLSFEEPLKSEQISNNNIYMNNAME